MPDVVDALILLLDGRYDLVNADKLGIVYPYYRNNLANVAHKVLVGCVELGQIVDRDASLA